MDASLYKQILYRLPDGITVQDRDFNIVYQNASMTRAFGDRIGSKCYAIYERRDAICEGCGLQKVFDSGEPNMVLRAAYDGAGKPSYWENSCSPIFDDVGNIIAGVEVCRNISDRVSLEADVLRRNVELGQLNKQVRRQSEDLRRANSDVERLLASMSSFLIELDRNEYIRRWNCAAENVFGVAAQDVVGKKFDGLSIFRDWEVMYKDLVHWPLVGAVHRWPEVRYCRRDGTDGFLSVSANPLRNEDGVPQGCFLLGIDISERRNLEMQLMQAQKLESVGRLAAGIAHEINTPTQYVGDNMEFLQTACGVLVELAARVPLIVKAVSEGKVAQSQLDEIRRLLEDTNLGYLVEQVPRAIEQSMEGVSRIASIVQAMKEFSHPGVVEKTSADLNQCIRGTVTVSRNEWKYLAELELELDESLPLVMCLPGDLNQALLNMIVNAAHAIGDVVGAGAETKGKITIATRREGPFVEIRIRDTGTGIPEDVREQIFDPFFTTKEVGRGTGQGLAIARNVIVDKHGGSISVETERGKGTCFTIRLPIEGEERVSDSVSEEII